MAGTRIDQLFYTLDLQRQGFDRAVADVQRSLKKMGVQSGAAASSLGRMEKQMGRLGRVASSAKGLILGFAGAFAGLHVVRSVARSLFGFETAMAEIATIAEGGTDAVAGFRQEILGLAREVPQSPRELAAGLYQVLSAGITESSDAFKVLRASSRAAVAGLTDTATAVDVVTTALNAFNLSADEAGRVTDVLFQTVRLGKLRFDTVANSIGAAATSASLAGVSLEELTAGMATMTLAGVDANEATASLNRLFLTLVNQTPAQAAEFEKLGIAFNTATVAEKGFAGLLEEVNKLTGGQIDALAKLFPNIRAARSAFVLAGNSMERYNDILAQVEDSTGAADEAFRIMIDTVENQARLFRNQLNARLQELAVRILPSLTDSLRLTISVMDHFTSATVKARREVADFIRETSAQGISPIGTARILARDLDAITRQIAAQREEIERLSEKAFDRLRLREAQEELDRLLARQRAIAEGLRAVAPELQLEGLRTEVDEFFVSFNKRLEQVGKADIEIRVELEAASRRQAIADAEEMIERLDLEGQERQRVASFIDEQRRAIARLQEQQAEEGLQAREKVETELARRISAVTQTAAEQELAAIDELEARYREAFGGTIPEAAEAGFARVREVAERALRLERAEELADSMRQAMTTALRDIELEASSITDAAERESEIRRQQVALYETMRDRATDLLDTAGLTEEEQEAIRTLLVEIVKLLNQAADAQGDIADAAERERKAAEERFRNLQSTVYLIRDAADGAIDLARAFGLVDENTAKILDNLAQIGTSATTLIGAIGTGNIPGIISGGLGVLGGIAGLISGDSQQFIERQRIQQDNTNALRELSRKVEDLTGSIDIAGESFVQTQQGLARLLGQGGLTEAERERRRAEVRQVGALSFQYQMLVDLWKRRQISTEEFDRRLTLLFLRAQQFSRNIGTLEEELARFGLTTDDLDAAAKELGITIRDSAGRIIPEALDDLLEALDTVEGSLIGFADTVAGTLAKVEFEAAIRDITDPVERLALLFQRLGELGDGLPFLSELLGLDVTTAEGRARADAIIRQIAQEILAGNQDLIAQLGVATQQEAIDLLTMIEGLLDDIAGGTEGTTQGVVRQVQITELQASQLLSYQATQTLLQERMEEELRAVLAIMSGEPPPIIVPPPPGIFPPGATNVNVRVGPVDITINPGASRVDGEAAADAFLIKIERELARRLTKGQQRIGLQ